MFKKNRSFLVLLFLSLFVVLNLSSVCAAEISQEAKRHMFRGQAAMEEAKNASDYLNAVKEFKKAVEYAPDWADAWFNLGVAQEKAKDYAGAINSFNKYLELNPTATDRNEVEGRIFKLEYKLEKESKPAERLVGKWAEQGSFFLFERGEVLGPMPAREGTYRIEAEGKSFKIISASGNSRGKVIFEASLDGFSIHGVYKFTFSDVCNSPQDFPINGEVDPDWNSMKLEYTYKAGVPWSKTAGGPITGCVKQEYRYKITLTRLP